MLQDGLDTKTHIDATINSQSKSDENTKKLKKFREMLWALMGLKMALDEIKRQKFPIEIICASENNAHITDIKVDLMHIDFDFENGLINGKDIQVAIGELSRRIGLDGGDEKSE